MRVKMSKQPPPEFTASAVGPCPTGIQIVGSILIEPLELKWAGFLCKNGNDLNDRHDLFITTKPLNNKKILIKNKIIMGNKL